VTASLEKDDRLQMGFKRPSREVQLIELAVFLLLIVPSMAASFFILSQEHLRFMAEAVNDLALLSLVLYFIWRNEEPIQHVGWTFNNFRKEIAWGLILFLPVLPRCQSPAKRAGSSSGSRRTSARIEPTPTNFGPCRYGCGARRDF
jgi:hypothetical protein